MILWLVATPYRQHAYTDLGTALRVAARIREMGITVIFGAHAEPTAS